MLAHLGLSLHADDRHARSSGPEVDFAGDDARGGRKGVGAAQCGGGVVTHQEG